jgi:hypothetical protein
MKKVYFLLLFLLITLKAHSQQNSTLWLKIQQIREQKFPETVNIPLGTITPFGKYGGYPATVSIYIDNQRKYQHSGINVFSLSQIAGIDYVDGNSSNETKAMDAAIYGSSATNGLILVYTKTYTLANPSIASTFK